MSLSCWDLGLPPRPRPARAHDTTRLELHRCTTHTLVCDLCVVVVSLSHCDLCIRTDTALLCMRSLCVAGSCGVRAVCARENAFQKNMCTCLSWVSLHQLRMLHAS